jgi:hypothetical protein
MASEAELRRQARQFATQYGVDPGIFEKQINEESRFNPNPRPSSAGAIGIAQIIPQYHPGVNPYDPIASLRYAASWDAQNLKRYSGSYPYMLAAYNWGPGRADQWNGGRKSLPAETQKYLDDILGKDWDKYYNLMPGESPEEPISSTIPGMDAIGRSITGAFRTGLSGWWDSLFTMGVDTFTDHYANQIFVALGIMYIGLGGIGLALQSAVGGAAIDAAASTGNPAAVGAAVVKKGMEVQQGKKVTFRPRRRAKPVNVSTRRARGKSRKNSLPQAVPVGEP